MPPEDNAIDAPIHYVKDYDIRRMLARGERLPATNRYCRAYGGDFAEVRAAIAAMEADDGITGYFPAYLQWSRLTDANLKAGAETLLRERNRIGAIQLCRESNGASLRCARQAVLQWEAALGLSQTGSPVMDRNLLKSFDVTWTYQVCPERRLLFWKRSDQQIKVRFEIVIAGHAIPDLFQSDAISWGALVASAESDGEYEIFTCSCGDMGCGGFAEVEVVHMDGVTIWLDNGWTFFDRAQYVAAIRKANRGMRELLHEFPATPILFAVDWNSLRARVD